VDTVESRRNGPQLSMRHDDDDDDECLGLIVSHKFTTNDTYVT